MLALLLLPVLVAGFLYCHVHPEHRVRLHRFEGQYLYLRCAQFGTKCFATACIIAFFGYHFIPDQGVDLFGKPLNLKISSPLISAANVVGVKGDDSAKVAWLFILTILTFASVYIFKLIAHLRLFLLYRKWDPSTELTGLLLEDSPLDDLLFKLSVSKKTAMLSMDDRKVYVGRIISLGEPSETTGMDQDVKIIPIMSGYRDKDTLDVEFTTQYSDGNAEIELCLRQESIVSATQFDFDANARWKEKKIKPSSWIEKFIAAITK